MTTTETQSPEQPALAPHARENVQLYPTGEALPALGRSARPALNPSKLTLVFADLLVVSLSFVIGTWLNELLNPLDPTTAREYMGLFLLSLPVWPVIFTQQLLYRARFLSRRVDETSRVIRGVVFGMLATAAISVFVKVSIGRSWVLIVTVLLLMFVVSERLIARAMFDRARRRGTLLRPVLIAGRNAEGRLVRTVIDDSPSLGYRFEGFIEDLLQAQPGESPLAVLGDPKRIIDLADRMGVNSVIVAATAIDVGSSNRLIRSLTEHGIHVEISSTLCDIASSRITVRPVGRVPMMYIEPVQRNGWRQFAKRAFDLAIAVPMFVLSLPILLPAMALVKITDPGPALFRQPRVGRDGEVFEMIKVRTMVVDAEARLAEIAHLNETTGVLFKVKDDPRITRVGRILRKLSIDELPQLINVIKGEMSLVGPRPALRSEAEQWDEELHNRLRVQPGITGMWQVAGRGDDDDHDATYAQLDLYYVDNWSLVTDLVILARTVPVVLTSRGQT
ncbi:MAG: sugar transferase [Actinomycetota bacterium]